MFGHKKRKIRILCLKFRIFIAVTIHCDNTVGIFRYNCALRIHTEGTYQVFEILCSVYNLTLIDFIRQIRKYNCRQFNTYTDVHTVGLGWNIHFLTDSFHPFAAASSDGDDTLFAGGSLILAVVQGVHGIVIFDRSYRSQEEEIHLLFQFVGHS